MHTYASSDSTTIQKTVPASRMFWQIWERFGIFLILVLFVVVLSLLTDRFLTGQNLFNLTRQISMLTLITMGELVVIITGNVDLTVGGFMGLSGVLIAGWAFKYGPVAGLLMAFFVALVVGLNNGFLVTRGKSLSVIVTLSMFIIFQGVALLFTQGRPIFDFPAVLRIPGTLMIGPVPAPVVLALLGALVIHIMLRYTRFGRELYAIGGNQDAARLSGIPVRRRIITAYIISACLSAFAGLILIGRVSSAQPTAGFGDEMSAIGAVLIGGASMNGGAGSVIGTLAGILILGMISNGLNLLQVNPYYQYVVKGLIILFAILMDQWGRK